MDHFINGWSTLVAVAAGGTYLFDQADSVYKLYLLAFAMAYFVADIFHCRAVNKIHHFCAVGLTYTLWDNAPLFMFLCKMELTTILFNLLLYAPASLKPVVMGAFFLGFLKIRVVEFYFFLQDPAVEAWFAADALSRTLFYTLYAINLYWFSLILKKCWGKRTQGARYAVLCQKIAAYTYLGTIPATMACPNLRWVHLFTATTSYFYHNAVAADAPRVGIFVLDSIAVHAVTFVNMKLVTTSTFLMLLSSVVNLGTLAARFSLIPSYDLGIKLSCLAIACDCLVVALSGAPTSLKFDYVLQFYLIFLSVYFEVLNEMSFLCFHVIIWFNARTMAKI
jgi:hypothetical protein